MSCNLSWLCFFFKPFARDRFLQNAARVREALLMVERSDWEQRARRMLAGAPGRAPLAKKPLVSDTDRAYFLMRTVMVGRSSAGFPVGT